MRYAITTWFGNLSVKLKTQIYNLTKRAGKIIGRSLPLSPQEIFDQAAFKQGQRLANDPTHILQDQFELMPSGKRYRVPHCRLNRYKTNLFLSQSH